MPVFCAFNISTISPESLILLRYRTIDNKIYLSVIAPPASSGSTGFTLQTYNATPNTTVSFTVTGLASGMTESQTANTIIQQASAAILVQNLQFSGPLSTTTDPISGYYGLGRTDHCISFFNQAQFSITQTSDSTGGSYYIGSSPVLVTVAGALAYGPLANQIFQGCNGVPLNTAQIGELLAQASAELTATLNNKIVMSYYIYNIIANQTNAVQVQAYPIMYIYNPYVYRPTIIAEMTLSATFDLSSRYWIEYDKGWIHFRFAQDLLFNFEPFDYGNYWIGGYIAGEYTIPGEIKLAVLRFSYMIQTFSNISSMSDGVAKITFERNSAIDRREAVSSLRKYMR